jgi:hypothetical protein
MQAIVDAEIALDEAAEKHAKKIVKFSTADIWKTLCEYIPDEAEKICSDMAREKKAFILCTAVTNKVTNDITNEVTNDITNEVTNDATNWSTIINKKTKQFVTPLSYEEKINSIDAVKRTFSYNLLGLEEIAGSIRNRKQCEFILHSSSIGQLPNGQHVILDAEHELSLTRDVNGKVNPRHHKFKKMLEQLTYHTFGNYAQVHFEQTSKPGQVKLKWTCFEE